MSNNNEVVKTEAYKTNLVKANDIYLNMIETQMNEHKIPIDEYSKVCVVNAVGAINDLLATNNLSFGSAELDTGALTNALITVATLKLNAKAVNREIFFQLRNKNFGTKDNPVWKKCLEYGIEGDGWDSLISNFGRGVKKVYPFWAVRSGDKYVPARHKGLEVLPPEWEQCGSGDVVRVVYPIEFHDGSVHYYTCERDDVLKNLFAHINNNIMNETFGICKDRFKATADEKTKIAAKKKEILDKAQQLGWAVLDTPEMSEYISPSWTEFHSRESMIIRKMRNRICKIIPKDLGNAFVSDIYHKASDETYATAIERIEANNDRKLIEGEIIDMESGEVVAAKPNF